MANLSDDLHDDAVEHVIDLLRYSESIREGVTGILDDLADELRSKILDADLAGQLPRSRITRMEALIRQIQGTIAAAYRQNTRLLRSQLAAFAKEEGKAAVEGLNAAIGIDIANVHLNAKELEVLAGDTLIYGAPSAEWWAGQAAAMRQRFAQQIRLGVTSGETNDQLVNRILGVRTGERRTITDQNGNSRTIEIRGPAVIDTSRREADALVRTSVQSVSNEVLQQTYLDNQDILRGVQWLSTLDPRTCIVCGSRDGATWDFENNPLPPTKIPFPGRPPGHWQCRCVLIPIVKSWNQLIEESGGKRRKELDSISDGTRASMDGQVASTMTYQDWLKKRSAVFQEQVLGKRKAALFRAGKLTLADMVDQSGRPLRLDELFK